PTLERTATTVVPTVAAATGAETTRGALIATVTVERGTVVVPTLERTATTVVPTVAAATGAETTRGALIAT
ncbi:hypothetical protein QC334_38290, partial [Streptomyces sp. DH18]|uniref:hypothetical protein n=1 Tax=Streptomyces sp. DH18 TaxID=3040126 RepID=UPI0024416833